MLYTQERVVRGEIRSLEKSGKAEPHAQELYSPMREPEYRRGLSRKSAAFARTGLGARTTVVLSMDNTALFFCPDCKFLQKLSA